MTDASLARPDARGREAVRAALLQAAGELFAERSPAEVSVREIARRAGVNHGLVHRHFGSKEALRREAMQRLADATQLEVREASGALSEAVALFEGVVARSAYWRSLARAMIDGEDPGDVQHRFPVAEHLLEQRASREGLGPAEASEEARLDVAFALASALGWLVFEPYLLRATGLEDQEPQALRAGLIERLMAAPHPGPPRED